MNEFYFSVNLDEGRRLCLAPLSDRNLALSGQEISDISGLFLFEKSGDEERASVEIIAQVFSEEAALRLRDALGMA
jgi:hypothetical protein